MLAFLDFLDPAFRSIYVVLGIGFLIFIHEGGHFIAARMCGVRCDIFSLGFGPALFKRTWRGTEYRISVVPLGGYVKMAGAEPGEEEGLSDELNQKSVGARFWIYLAGPLMNGLFAFVVFPILFLVGVPFIEPVISSDGPIPGGPAWTAGLRGGDRVLKVGGSEVHDFKDMMLRTALGAPQGVTFEVDRNGDVLEFDVVPQYSTQLGFQVSGTGELPRASAQRVLIVEKDSDAWKAGLRSGDKLLTLNDKSLVTNTDFGLALEVPWRRGDIQVEIERDGEQVAAELACVSPAEKRFLLGIQPLTTFVSAVRPMGLVQGEHFEQLQAIPEMARLVDVNGWPIFRTRELEVALRQPLADAAGDQGRARHVLTWRKGEESGSATFAFARSDVETFAHDLRDAIALSADLERAIVVAKVGGPADLAGIAPGDEIVRLGDADDLEKYASANDMTAWEAVIDIITKFTDGQTDATADPIRVGLLGKDQDLMVRPELELDLPFKLATVPREYVKREGNLLGAIQIGVQRSLEMFGEVYLTLKRMLSGTVSSKNLGSIVMIAQASYNVSKTGLIKFLFFLGLLSINLAVINLLPIPVLDGGHLFFLIIEKIKGSRVNDRVMGYAQMVGILLVLSLIIYATANDIMRLFSM